MIFSIVLFVLSTPESQSTLNPAVSGVHDTVMVLTVTFLKMLPLYETPVSEAM